jgi:asparagine synthase (glutamine-hydrolysing)
MKLYIPVQIVEAEKRGFSSPDASWFKGESSNFVEQSLFTSNSPLYEFMDKQTIKRLLNQHMHGEKNQRLLIWSLLNVDSWMKQNLG